MERCINDIYDMKHKEVKDYYKTVFVENKLWQKLQSSFSIGQTGSYE